MLIFIVTCATPQKEAPQALRRVAFTMHFKGQTKAQLYDRAHEWILLAEPEAMKAAKRETGLLIARGSLTFQYYAIRLPTKCTFRILIRARDGSVTMRLDNLIAHWEVWGNTYNEQPVWSVKSVMLIRPQLLIMSEDFEKHMRGMN